MKEEILSIASDLREGFITSNEAKEQLLRLFGISRRSEQLSCGSCNKEIDAIDKEIGLCDKCGYELATAK